MDQFKEDRIEAWCRTWGVIVAMKGLRRLHVRLLLTHTGRSHVWGVDSLDYLGPIRSTTIPSVFTLVVPNESFSTDLDVGSSKCVLQHPDEPIWADESWKYHKYVANRN